MHIKYESNCKHINRIDEIKIYTFIFFVIIIVIVIKDNVKLSTHLITYTNTYLLFPSNKVP